MKAGIITYHNVINYGAALQALATQETLTRCGCQAEIINYTPSDVFDVYRSFSVGRFRRCCKKSLKFALRDVASNLKNYPAVHKKRSGFAGFGRKYFHYSGKPCANYEKLKKRLPEYDLCFTGSDQVWNPDITYGFDPAYFLDFGKKNMVRASYAASIGRERFSKEEQKTLSDYLQKLDYISARERTGAEVLSAVTDKPVNVVLDPTLLLNAKQWKELLSIKAEKGGYILVYTLYPNPQLDRFVEKLSKEKNLPVVTLGSKKRYFANGKTFPCADPQKFVELFANADFVVTNSFHGTAFSVNFSRNFMTFMGQSRNSRMTDLLTALGIPERAVTGYSDELLAMPDIDYAWVQAKLDTEREHSLSYIKTVLERAEAK